jgi:hypothetical protein
LGLGIFLVVVAMVVVAVLGWKELMEELLWELNGIVVVFALVARLKPWTTIFVFLVYPLVLYPILHR